MSAPSTPPPASVAGSRFSGSFQIREDPRAPTSSYQNHRPGGTSPRKLPLSTTAVDGASHGYEPHLALGEYHSGFDAHAEAVPPRRSAHQRHLSFPNLPNLPNLLPLAIRNRTNSPERRTPRPSTPDEMPFTGDGRRDARNADAPRGGGLAGWLSPGSPSRTDAGTPRGSPSSSHGGDATPTRPRDPLTPKGASQAPSRFAVLASSMSATLSRLTQTPISPTLDDELLSLDVDKALFPSGPPSDRDIFSPAAFKNLQTNAAGLLRKMQAAYRTRTSELHDLAGDKSALRDELDEAETRSRHLKMQLEGMARHAAHQEAELRALADELAAERRARAHERLMLEKGPPGPGAPRRPGPTSDGGGSLVSEDLGVDEDKQRRHRRRRWRKSLKSDGSFETTTDDESGGEEEDESVFSRPRSPAAASALDGAAAVVDGPVSHPRVAALGQQGLRARPAAAQPMNALQKLVKNVMASREDGADDEYAGPGCRNCRGQDASFAWNTVSLLRDENKHLKQRVGQLEAAVDGALDLVGGLGLDLP